MWTMNKMSLILQYIEEHVDLLDILLGEKKAYSERKWEGNNTDVPQPPTMFVGVSEDKDVPVILPCLYLFYTFSIISKLQR